MSQTAQIAQLVVETGVAFCVGFLPGLAFAREYRDLLQRRGSDGIQVMYWPLVRRGFWLAQCLGWSLLGWLFLGGSAYVDMAAAGLGVLVGNFLGLARADASGAVRKVLALGLILCGVDYGLELTASGFSGRLVGPLVWGLGIAGGVAVISLLFWLLSKALGRESRAWAFRLPALGSLFLTSGGPFLWLVLASSVAFGFSCSARYVPHSLTETVRWSFLVGFGSVAVGHAMCNFYFYEMASYGIFWHPVVAVGPYALGGMAIGFLSHRVGRVTNEGATVG